MDVRIHELALDIARSRGRAHGRRRSNGGSTASCSRSRVRSTRAPTRSSATSSPTASSSSRGVPDALRVHRRPDAVRRRVARPARQGVHARARARRVGRRRRPRRHALWNHLAEMGVFGMLVPEAAGGLGGTEVDLVLLLEELGRAAVPGPVLETAAVVAPRARRRRRPSAPPRSTVRRTCPTRTSPPWSSCPGGVLRTDDATSTAGRRASTAAVGLFTVDGARSSRSRTTRRWPSTAARSAAAAYLVGLERAHDRRRRRVRAPARAVRPADRREPGGEAPARRRAVEGRVRQARGVPRRLVGRRGRADAQRATSRWPRRSPATPPTARAAARCRCTARSATRGKRTCSSG